MAICLHCGNEGNGKFCENCGAPLTAAAQPEPEAQDLSGLDSTVEIPAMEPDEVETPDGWTGSRWQPEPEQPASTGAYVPPAGAGVAGSSSATTQDAGNLYTIPGSDGLLKLAFNDVVHDPKFVMRTVLLSLLSCIPILNFVSTGYCLRWGRTAAFRTGDQMPSSMFGDKTFSTGFFCFLISLVWGLVIGLVASIPVVGIVGVFAVPFMGLGVMLMAMWEDLGAGFSLGKLWEVGKRDYFGVLVLIFAPALVATLVMMVVLGVWALLTGSGIAVFAALGDLSNATIVSGGIGATLITGIMVVACMIIAMAANLVSYRALGYWVGRNAHEWVRESVTRGVNPR